jgi:excisionase family DNA binding protein
MSDILTLREAADQLGVHYMTVYRYVRLGLLPAHKEGRTWRIASRDLDIFQQEKASGSSHPESRRTTPWFVRLENRLLAGDATGAWKVIEASLSSGFTPVEVYTDLFVPALHSVGDRWASEEIGVEDEHMVSNISIGLVGRLSPHFSRPGRRRGTVVVSAPPGESHGLGLAMASDVLRGAGYTVVDLGVNTPVEALERVVVRSDRIRAVCIGVTMADYVDEARNMVRAARRHLGRTRPVIVGGAALRDVAHARRLGADQLADLSSVAAAVELGATVEPGVVI